MTDAIGTDEERELIERGRSYGSSIAPHTADGDTVLALADALQSRIAEVAQFCAIMDKTETEGFSPNIEQELMDLRAALQQRNQNESGHTSQK